MIDIQVQNPLTGLWTTVQTVGQDSSVGLYTYDIPLTVTAFEAGLRRL
jgi:hypothetical protein